MAQLCSAALDGELDPEQEREVASHLAWCAACAQRRARQVELEALISREEILDLLQIVRKLEVPDAVLRYAADIVRATRLQTQGAPAFIKEWLQWGVGPRGGLYLVLGAKASAMLDGRAQVSAADVRRVAKPVLCHRLITTYQADAEGMTPEKIVDKLLEHVPAPDGVAAA